MASIREEPAGSDPVDDLLAECLAAPDVIVAIEAAAGVRPDLAAELRRRFEFLLRAGALPDAGTESTPRRLGNFELHERLGGGGMGIVYRATEQGIGRDVALKLIRPEQLWFDGARKRFLREIEAVAALDHPGIVAIYSAGEHDGVPFCAMELVRGRSLAEVLTSVRDDAAAADPAMLRQSRATNWTEACFAVVRQVAEALAHGHERGIVHRDVKPSNVMISDDGRARLIDFGLAHLATADSLTRSGVQPGSLAYMSPEQVRGAEVDGRTDVWSLGVTLCELLTLRQPFLAATEAETRKHILESVAPVMTSRGSRLPWDAATVVATAMAPERERRYATMAAFANDLQAILDHRPIQARRPGPWLRARRWLQRHPARAAVGLAFVVLFGVLPTVLLLQEHAAKGRVESEALRARAAELEATRKATTSQRVVQFLRDLFYEADPERARGNTMPVRVILDRGVQRIRTELQDEPEVRAELLETMGTAYADLGLIAPARQLIEETRQLRQQLHQASDRVRHSLEMMARLAADEGREAESEQILHELLAGLPATETVMAADYEIGLANCEWQLGRLEQAEQMFEHALQSLRDKLPSGDMRLVSAQRAYARYLMSRVDPRAARDLLQHAASDAAARMPPEHPTRISIELELAVAEIGIDDLDAATSRLRAAIVVAERVFDPNHPTLASLRQWLATALLQSDHYREGLQAFEPMQRALTATYQAPHLLLARAASLESSLSIELGDLPRAEAAARKAIAMFEQLYPDGHLDFAYVLANLARIQTQLGDFAGAEQLAERSVAMHRGLGQRRDDELVLPMCYQAEAQAMRNNLTAAEQNARDAISLATTGTPPAGRRTLAMARGYLAEVLLLANKGAEGEQQARSALAGWQSISDVGRARARFLLGWAFSSLGRLDEAEPELRASLDGLQQFYAPSHPFFADVLGELGVLQARRGELAAAVETLQRAVDIRRAAGDGGKARLLLPLLNLAAVLNLLHRDEAAATLGFECLELVRQNGGGNNRCAPSTLLLLAKTVPTLADSEVHRQQLAQVRAAVDELLPKDFPHRAELEQLLARGR